MRKQVLIFDFDGTIHETLAIYRQGVIDVVEWLKNEHGMDVEVPPDDRIVTWLGLSTPDMWNDFMPDLPKELQEEGGKIVGLGMIRGVKEKKSEMYEGMEDVLDELKSEGYFMTILSNCDIIYRDAQWDRFDLGRWFTVFYDCESFDFEPKSEIIKELKYDAECLLIEDSIVDEGKKSEKNQRSKGAGDALRFVMIGDRKSDMQAARAIGAKFIGCAYGYGKAGEIEGADAIANSPADIPKLLKQLA